MERQPSEFTDISSLDEKLIRGVVRLDVERGRLSKLALTEPIEDVLNKWKLSTGKRPLNATTAFFTKDTGMYTQFTMRLARFQRRGVVASTWSIDGSFVVVTFMRPAKGNTQSGIQVNEFDKWIENQIRERSQITTEELAKISKKGLRGYQATYCEYTTYPFM